MPLISLPYTIPDATSFQYFMLVLAVTTSFSSVPQVLSLYHSKSSRDVSLFTWAVGVGSSLCWVIYGLAIQDLVVALSSFIGMLFSLVVSLQCLYYRREPKARKRRSKKIPEWNDY